jgi:hypothetical protein
VSMQTEAHKVLDYSNTEIHRLESLLEPGMFPAVYEGTLRWVDPKPKKSYLTCKGINCFRS